MLEILANFFLGVFYGEDSDHEVGGTSNVAPEEKSSHCLASW